MTSTHLVALGVAALLLFWMLGAHNRLMTLRNAIAAAWAQLDDALRLRGQAVAELTTQLRAHLPHEHGSLDALLVANTQVQGACATLRVRPTTAALAGTLAGAEVALGASLSRVLALLEQHPALLADGAVAPPVQVLRQTEPRLAFGRQLFNNAATAYNQAALQWPTRAVTRLFGFSAAGLL